MKGLIGLTLLGALLGASLAAPAAEVADYRFEGSFASSIAGAPALEPVVADAGAFAGDAAAGRTVWTFPEGAGLALDTAGLLAPTVYSIALQLRVAETDPYMKVIDTSGLEADTGFYVIGDDIGFYNVAFGNGSIGLQPDVYYLLVVTRAADGTYVGYVDGIERFRFTDDAGLARIPADGTLYFLRDDEATFNGENASGAIARLRVFDTALTAAEVAALGGGTRIFRDGFEG